MNDKKIGAILYTIISVAGICIRQFLLPNPFEPLGDIAEGLNLLFGGLFVPVSFAMAGIMYKRGSGAIIGSILFTATYALNTLVAYLVFLVYPTTWLMILIGAAYIVIYVVVAILIRVHVLYP